MALDEVTRASLAALLAIIILVPMAAPAALARQPPAPPVPRRGDTETPVRAFILDLPGGAPSRYSLVALYRGHVVPLLAIPYPLKPFTAARIKAVIVEGKPLQQLLREDPEKARRLLFEDKNVTVVTAPVKGLAWEPDSKKLLVILPAGEAALRGKELATREITVLDANTVVMYRAGGYEIRLVKPVKTLVDMGLLLPPFVPIMMNDTVYGYSVTIGKARLDIDVTPDRIERLAASATELRPITPPRAVNPIIAATTTSTNNNVWMIPYTEPFPGPNGLPKAMQAIDMPSTETSANYYNCWTYQPLQFTYMATASATIVPLTAANVNLTVAIYMPWMPWTPIAEKSTVTHVEAGQSVTVTAEWEIPVLQRPNPPKLRVCVYATADWTSVGEKHANLYVALGGYKKVTLRSPVQPSPSDNTYEVKHQFAVENDVEGALVAKLTTVTTIPVAITPNIAPGPLSFATYVEGGSADFYLGDTHLGHVVNLGHVPPNQFYYRSLDPETALAALTPYIISGRAIPLTIEPHGRVKWYAGYTTISYTAYMLTVDEGTDGNAVYRLAGDNDRVVSAEPLLLQILLASDGTVLEAGEASTSIVASRPEAGQLDARYFAVDVAASVKHYSYGIGKVSLQVEQEEEQAHVLWFMEKGARISGSSVRNDKSQYVLWLAGAAGLVLGGIGEAGIVSGVSGSAVKAASYLLSVASTALSEPHVFAVLSEKVYPLESSISGDSVSLRGGADSGSGPWSNWRSVVYHAFYTLYMRGSEHPVQMSIAVGVHIKLDWSYAWQEVLCFGTGFLEFSPVK